MDQAEKRVNNHLTGKTEYIDDIELPQGALNGYVYYSPYARANIVSIDYEEAMKVEGVVAILSAKDIPGINDMGAVIKDEPILATKTCNCIGQAILLIAATDRASADRAKALVKIHCREIKPILDVEESYSKGDFPFEPYHLKRGRIKDSFKHSDHIIEGTFKCGAQEHFYLETQSALATITEDGSLHVRASTQNPSEAQHLIARSLNMNSANIEVETGRLGGGFGGKETQGNWCAIWASLLAYHTGKSIKMVLSREEDMIITGKRHPVTVRYKAGFTKNGKILAYKAKFLFDIGCSSDLSQSIIERCLLHCENAYYIPSVEVDLYPCKTNTASNCAFRGFGAPQGIAAIENVMDIIAKKLRKDPFKIRKINLYGIRKNNITPYGQRVSDNSLPYIFAELYSSSNYKERVREIKQFNRKNSYCKRGIGVVPVKFGISFTTTFLNQGSALVNLYKDGSLAIHQGGVEMGQGLYDKIIKVASKELRIPTEKIKLYNTNTSIIPNTPATAASTGSDINGHAVLIAVRRLKKRLERFYMTLSNDVSFTDMLNKAYMAQINLSEKAYYKTPGIFFNRKSCKGKPFYYYVYGLSISEVEVDTLTGNYKILRSDILHDTGYSIDEVLDKGQIEGAFIQGAGWCTMENLIHDEKGYPVNANPDAYKIPGIADIPLCFNVSLYQKNPFSMGVLSSRAIGEPPFIYGISVWSAIRNALKDLSSKKFESFNMPATKENIFLNLIL